jgi:membrane-associated protease RseP (regulator of RpoE activity)
MSEPIEKPAEAAADTANDTAAFDPVSRPRLAFTLFALTLLSTTYVGSLMEGGGHFWERNFDLLAGLPFSLPMMSILVAHELGHYIAARLHLVPASLPYFVPLPLPPLGTMGAVILMPPEIKSRNALLDIGAAGPLAGLVVALPVLAYGIATSPVLPQSTDYHLLEGHSLLYAGMLYLLKGPIPAGYDIMLSSTAFAGWAGLLVTMLNLIPALQLDGGHVAHALLGDRQESISRFVRKALFPLGIGVCAAYGLSAFFAGKRGDALLAEAQAGTPWLLWAAVLYVMARANDREHPPIEGEPLSPVRHGIACFTLALFVLLFMPAWLRQIHPS